MSADLTEPHDASRTEMTGTADIAIAGDAQLTNNDLLPVPLRRRVLLTIAMELLEASGYLARGAFLVDRLLRAVGLGGRAFVPLLTGHACAVPAIAASTCSHSPDRAAIAAMGPSGSNAVVAVLPAVATTAQGRSPAARSSAIAASSASGRIARAESTGTSRRCARPKPASSAPPATSPAPRPTRTFGRVDGGGTTGAAAEGSTTGSIATRTMSATAERSCAQSPRVST